MAKKRGKLPAGFARKRDANEPEIIAALEAAGATVFPLDKPLDLLVGFRGQTFLLEVKNGAQPPSWQRVTPAQSSFIARWAGHYAIVNSPQAALDAIGAE